MLGSLPTHWPSNTDIMSHGPNVRSGSRTAVFMSSCAIPGLTIVVLQAALIFFNADYVERRVIEIADALGDDGRWLVLDAEAINLLDSTGVAKLEELQILLSERGLAFGIADLNSRSLLMVEQAGLADRMGRH
jgi:sulfate permease, SulP family